MTIIEKIVKLMKENKTTQVVLSENIGVSQGNISDWINGRSTPSTEAIVKISDYYNVSTDYLLGRTEIILISSLKRDERKKLIETYLNLTRTYNMMSEYEELKIKNISDSRLEEIVRAVEDRIEKQGMSRNSNVVTPITKSQLKLAIWGTTDIDDEVLEETKRAGLILQQLKAEKTNRGEK